MASSGDIPKGSDEKIVPKEGAVVMESTAADDTEAEQTQASK